MKFLITTLILQLCFLSVKAQEIFSLKECITYGLENHSSIIIASNKEMAAKASSKEALAGYLPKVSLNGSIDDNLKVQEQVIPAGVFGDEDLRVAFTKQFNTTGTVELNQTIYDQSLIIGLKARKFYTKQSELSKKQSKEELIYTITSDYYQALVYKLQIQLLEENLQTYKEQLRIADLQVKKGVLAKVDFKKVQVDYNTTLSKVRSAENNLQNSLNTLKYDIGFPLNTSLKIGDADINFSNEDYSGAFNKTIFEPSNRTEYLLDSINTGLLEIDYKRIKTQNLPKLSFYARYGLIGFGDELDASFNSVQSFSAIGIKLSSTLFEGFGKTARANQAKLEYLNAIEQQKLNASSYKNEALNATNNLETAKTNIDAELENIALAQSVFKSTDLQYSKGVATLRDWLDDQFALKEAQNNYLSTVVDYYVAILDLQKAQGSLETFYKALND